MKDPVLTLFSKLMAGLAKAGRDKKKIDAFFLNLDSDMSKQAGYGSADWSDEYYVYLLETYRQALSPALDIAVQTEEFEWAQRLKARLDELEKSEASAEKKLQKVF